MTRIEIICAAPIEFITEATGRGIHLHNIRYVNDLTVSAHIEHKDYARLQDAVARCNGEIKILDQNHFGYLIRCAINRPILLLGIMCIIILTLYLPTRILFIEVYGTSNVSKQKIISCLENNGISFGTIRGTIRNEHIKNALLSEIPQLQWIGINTYGCVAKLSVKERIEKPEKDLEGYITGIVSVADSVVSSVTVRKGTPLCSIGQAVKEGQKLVSGYTDCGISIRGERAVGEIYGYTQRNLAVLALSNINRRSKTGSATTVYSLKIGKRLINLFKNGSNLEGGCAKIYSERYMTLPGGFILPIAVVKETCITYMNDSQQEQMRLYDWVPIYIENYLYGQMANGQILERKYLPGDEEQTYSVVCRYFCQELIGREIIEELIQ